MIEWKTKPVEKRWDFNHCCWWISIQKRWMIYVSIDWPSLRNSLLWNVCVPKETLRFKHVHLSLSLSLSAMVQRIWEADVIDREQITFIKVKRKRKSLQWHLMCGTLIRNPIQLWNYKRVYLNVQIFIAVPTCHTQFLLWMRLTSSFFSSSLFFCRLYFVSIRFTHKCDPVAHTITIMIFGSTVVRLPLCFFNVVTMN